MTRTDDERQRHRARYEALRAAGQGEAARALPPPSARGAAMPAGAALHHEQIPGGAYWTTRLAPGDALRIADVSGRSPVALLAWSVADPSERLNLADTVKVQWSIVLRKGRVLFTDMGRIALSIIEDSCGAHDVLVGPTTAASMQVRLGPGAWRNSRDNFCIAAAKLGLSRRDIPPCLTLFAPVTVGTRGEFGWDDARRAPGDHVDLRAEMDLWVVLSNAGHPLDPALAAVPAPIDVWRHRPTRTDDDPCRRASAEATRAFALTERHLAPGRTA